MQNMDLLLMNTNEIPVSRSVMYSTFDHYLSNMFHQRAFLNVKGPPDKAGLVVFPGGADINPRLYGEDPLPQTFFKENMDNNDLAMWDKIKDNKDIFKVGVCRGGQFLNVMNGGKLWQHVDNHRLGMKKTHRAFNLITIPGTKYRMSTIVQLTSTHHQMMIPHESGHVLCIANEANNFYSADEVRQPEAHDVEVVWYPETRCLCFQPHPEVQTAHETRDYFFSLIAYLRNT